MTIKPTLDAATYAVERAICDKANTYWEAHASHSKGGSSMSAELAAHPDYAACSNAMRSRVEQYELLTNPPERFTAYIGQNGKLTTGCGDVLGAWMLMSCWRTPRSFVSSHMGSYHVMMAGKKYHGRSGGEGLCINLRAVR
jgi:hypothetical protein